MINDCIKDNRPIFENALVGKRFKFDPKRPGVIGCALSHIKIFNKMIDEKIPIAYVLEDDANVKKELPDLDVKKFEDVDLIYINNRNYADGNVIELGNLLVMKCNKPKWGADGYIITQSGCRKMLENMFPIVCPIDTVMRYFTNSCCDSGMAKNANIRNLIENKHVELSDEHKNL